MRRTEPARCASRLVDAPPSPKTRGKAQSLSWGPPEQRPALPVLARSSLSLPVRNPGLMLGSGKAPKMTGPASCQKYREEGSLKQVAAGGQAYSEMRSCQRNRRQASQRRKWVALGSATEAGSGSDPGKMTPLQRKNPRLNLAAAENAVS